MNKLEPTYLRYVYDSLQKGVLSGENASGLPYGFIGIYEQEFQSSTPIYLRQERLGQLALWALFKGAVSTNMASSILGISEESTKELIATYSSWFNSPDSGKYQLYHERLRVYLLQKLKEDELQLLNEQLITYLAQAIKAKKEDESEHYALQNMAFHLALESQLGNQYERLHAFVNREDVWQRQIQLSKDYAWSQAALQQGIKEGARRQLEMNTIECTVNSVKLMLQEQNSAEDILTMVAEGDYHLGLKRAESWEGERQFKLYLLMLHELTLGDSKEASFRKEGCKAILEAIDQTPEDHSVLNWTAFYPELYIYRYHEELDKMDLDGMVIWRRGNFTLEDLININKLDMALLKPVASEITDARKKSNAYRVISKVLMERGDKEESLRLASEITDPRQKSEAYAAISKVLMEGGDKEESLRVASEIFRGDERIRVFTNFGQELHYEVAQELLATIPSETNRLAVVSGMSKRIQDSMENSLAINPYLYRHADKTKYLSNILFYQAKIACFFEKERNEKKLELLSTVLDIKDWRRISTAV